MPILTYILASLLSGSINFKSLPIEESGTNINTVCQDSLGRIWLGGNDGIVRYDGNRYEHFDNIIKHGEYVPDISVYDILCDRQGTIWVAHISGLSKFDCTVNSFIDYPSPNGSLREVLPLPSGNILTIAGDRLWYFNISTGTFTREGIPDILFVQSISTIYRVQDSLFIGTKTGRLFMCSADMNQMSEINTDPLDSRISCICNDGDSHLWIGTEDNGLWEIFINDSICRRVQDKNNSFNSDVVKALCLDNEGSLWIGTKNGLKILKDGDVQVYHHGNSPSTIPHDSVGDFLIDRQGTMWLGTYYGGVCYFSPHSSSFRQVTLNSPYGDISGSIISDIVEDADGTLWIGSNSTGLIRMDSKGRIQAIKSSSSADSQLDVKCIYISPYSGRIYVGADRSEIFMLNNRTTQLLPMADNCPRSCYAIEYNRKDGFYMGTYDGLYEYNERTGHFSRIYFTGDNTNIKSLHLDSNGILWIGRKNGITAINKEDSKLHELPEQLKSVKYAEIIIEDSIGRIWIGSRSGLYCYNPKTGESSSFTERDGLPHHIIHGIEEDRNGILWISTDRGLCRFNPETSDKVIFTTSDGLLDNRFTTYAHCSTKSGELCFGSINGIVLFDPGSISLERKTLPPAICGMEVNGVWEGVPEGIVVLEPTERSVTFMFSSADFVSGKNGRFYYKLEGVDADWNMASMDWKASYQNLPHGVYTFMVRYVDSSGKESEVMDSIQLKKREFWYKTTAAIIIYTIILLFLTLFIINYQVTQKEKKYKDKMDQFRSKILHDFSLEFRNQNSIDNKTEIRRDFDESDEKFMRHAMKVVRENMDNTDFSVDDFAGKMFMSRSNLNLKVKALFGVSPLELIKTVRFNEACRLLREKKHTMSEISDMVGFTTSSYFAAAFKKFMGCTPSDYIKKNN